MFLLFGVVLLDLNGGLIENIGTVEMIQVKQLQTLDSTRSHLLNAHLA